MPATVLYKILTDIIPVYMKNVKSYVRKDERSIILRFEGGQELLFTYIDPNNWDLCTLKKGEK